MDKFLDKIQKFVVPLSEKISSIKFLRALAETMMVIMPVTVVGSFACLFAFIDFVPWQNFLTANPTVKMIFMNTQSWTLSIIALYVILILPYRYAEHLEIKEKINVVPLAVASFLLLTPTELYTSIPSEWLGHQGMFSAMIIGYIVTRTCKFFLDKKITIKMPAGVPKFVENTFTVLIPGAVVILVSAVVGQLLSKTAIGNFHNIIYTVVQLPLKGVGLSFPSLLLEEILMTLFMFCGIHGTVAGTYMTPILTAANVENLAAFTAGEPLPNIITTGFQHSIQAGGIGATLGLAILLVVFAKSERFKKLGGLAIVPQIFNIGEPLLFGIPIMLNPILFIPYMGGVIVNTFIAYYSVYFGIVGRFTGVDVSWTLPMGLNGFLACSKPIQGMLLQLVLVVVDMLIWYPFVKIIDKQALAEEKK
ncbi:MAG: PTS sugar transporter subunit IIC [Chloroflexi bacterium]|nr:PTS sugar transporter subunit IIC [Chloroflexota bacterium]